MQENLKQAENKARLKQNDYNGKQARLQQQSRQQSKDLERIDSFKDEMEKYQNNIADTEKAIKKKEAQATQKQKELSQKEQVLVDVQGRDEDDDRRQMKETKAELNNVGAQISQRQTEKRGINGEISDLHDRVKRVEVEIKQKEDVRNQAWKNLRQSNKHVEIPCTWLRDNMQDKFQDQVFEPICLGIDVVNAKDAGLVENFIPKRDMSAFVTQNNEDHETLTRESNKQKWTINIVKDPQEQRSKRFTMDDLKQYGFTCVVSDLFNAPEPIMRYLNHTHSLDQVPIGPRNNKASQIAKEVFEKFGISRTVFGDVQITTQRSQYGGKNIFSKESSTNTQARLLGASVDEGEMKELRAQRKQHQKEYNEYESQKQALESEEKAFRKTEEALRRKVDEIKNRVKLVQDAERAVTRLKKHLENLRTDVEESRSSVKTYNRKLETAVENYVRAILSLKASSSKVGKSATDLVRDKLVLEELDARVRTLKEQDKEIQKMYTLKEENLAREKQTMKNLKDQAKDTLKRAREAIGADAPNERLLDAFAMHPTTVEDLQNKLNEEKAKLACQAEVEEDAIEDYKQVKKQLKKLLKEIETFDKDYQKVTDQIKEVKDRWEPKLKELIGRISESFSKYMVRLKCDGLVDLMSHETDFAEYGIEISVRFREGTKLQRLEAGVQSGGEKSVSTMLYLMSLQDLSRCPFRVVDEINQGMDPRNERLVYSQVMHASENSETSQYFVITPKLLPNLAYSPSMRVLLVMNGKRFDARNFSSPYKRLKTTSGAGRRQPGLTAPANRS